jgi:hypothetical protein
MAFTPVTVLYTSGHSVTFSVVEDGAAAAAALTYDVLAAYLAAGGLATSSFYSRLAVAHADQAAARTFFQTNCRFAPHRQTCALGGAAYYPQLQVDQNIVGGVVAGNFRLVLTGLKGANAATATWIVVFSTRFSVIQ